MLSFHLRKALGTQLEKHYWFQRQTLNIYWASFAYRDPGKSISFANKRKPKTKHTQRRSSPLKPNPLGTVGTHPHSQPWLPSPVWMALFPVNILFTLKRKKEAGKEGLLRSKQGDLRWLEPAAHLFEVPGGPCLSAFLWFALPAPSMLNHLFTCLQAFSLVKSRPKNHLPFNSIPQTPFPALSLVPFQPRFLK